MNKSILALAIAFLGFAGSKAQVVINEIMQSNIDCIMDDLNEFPDSWVELYNAGSESVELSDYSLGTSSKVKKAYKLPSAKLAPQQYRIVYCDKEDKNWHTSFRLESGKGCNVFLFKGNQAVDSIVDLKKQPAPNIAYGRKDDGADKWGYQAKPTPGVKNCGTVYKNILGDPVFSIPGRVSYSKGSTVLEITLPEDAPKGTEIRYTTDGTEPTESSNLYEKAITISGTRLFRAKLFCEGYLSPRSVTHSYIYMNHTIFLPVVSMVTNKDYFFDNKIGIYQDKKLFDGTENYKHNWRRPVNIEVFETTDAESVINQLCETRISGGATRSNPLKSLAVYANKRFGEKRLAYEFFPEERPGVTDFKSLMLRNAGNDFDYLYLRDAVIQRIMSENTDIDHQAYRPAIFILNGEYKGILNFRERSNEDNIYTNYDGLEDIDMIENLTELKTGTWDNWREFEKFYKQDGHTWEEYSKYVDLEEYLNVMIANLFFNNLDFPGNNIVWWRPTAEGGRWRILMKDTDFGLGLYNRSVDYKIFKWFYNNGYDWNNAWANKPEHTLLFRQLMNDETFKREFIDRCAIYMGDFLNYSRGWEIWSPMYYAIKDEYPVHRKLYNEWWPNYNDELRNAKNWLTNRVGKFYNQIYDYYKTGKPVKMTINKSLDNGELSTISVTINGVKLTRSKFDGMFFANREVKLEGENVAGWEIVEVSTTGQVKKDYIEGSTYTFTMPNSSSLAITAKLGSATEISNINADQDAKTVEVYDLAGTKAQKQNAGINVVKTEDGKTKKVWNK